MSPMLHAGHPVPLAARPLHSSASVRRPPSISTGPAPTLVYHQPDLSSAPAPPQVLPQSYTTQISDLLLSAVVPGIPKASAKKGAAALKAEDRGRRALTSKKEELNLTTTTQNFRKFVLKIGWLFAVQDRVEDVVFWRRPEWSISFLLAWTLLSFNPHLFLLVPSLALLAFLLSPYTLPPLQGRTQRRQPSVILEESARGTVSRNTSPTNERSPPPITRTGHGRSSSMGGPPAERTPRSSMSNSRDQSDLGPAQMMMQARAVEERKIEAGLSAIYYSNIQGIQNLMGMFSDLHDLIAPSMSSALSSSHVLHQTFIAANVLLVLALAFFGRWIPVWSILLPAGWIPLLIGLIPPSAHLPLPPPSISQGLSDVHLSILNDRIPLHLRDLPRSTVSIWESRRFRVESSVAGWGSSEWSGREVGSDVLQGGKEVGGLSEVGLEAGWEWMDGERWELDWSGRWIEHGVDLEGWSYASPHRQDPSPLAHETAQGQVEIGTLKRRRWWRRAVKVD